MPKSTFRLIFVLAGGIFGGWFLIRYALPVLFPFLLGTGLALAAEPAVSLFSRQLPGKRGLSAGVGVTLTLVLLTGVVFFLGALAVRELGQLAAGVPGMVRDSAVVLEDFLVSTSEICQIFLKIYSEEWDFQVGEVEEEIPIALEKVAIFSTI